MKEVDFPGWEQKPAYEEFYKLTGQNCIQNSVFMDMLFQDLMKNKLKAILRKKDFVK